MIQSDKDPKSSLKYFPEYEEEEYDDNYNG